MSKQTEATERNPLGAAFAMGVTADGGLLEKQISVIAKGTVQREQQIAIAAAGCVVLALKHRQCTPATKLVNALGDSGKGKAATMYRTNDLKNWFQDHGGMIWSSSKGAFHMAKETDDAFADNKSKLEKDEAAFIKALLDVPFSTERKQVEFEGFSLVKAINSAIARGEKLKEKYESEPDKLARIDLSGLVEAKRMLAHYKGKLGENTTTTEEATPQVTAH